MGVERQGGGQVSQARIREDTTSLLQALLDYTEGLPPLQDNCVITIDLSYYDEVPIDYQPKGFKDSEILQVPNGKKKAGFTSYINETIPKVQGRSNVAT